MTRTTDPSLPAMGYATRREFLIGAASMLVLGAAGCGGEGASSDNEASGRTRTIEHKYGSTEITGVPRRVVPIGYTDQDPLLALGVVPIAIREWFGNKPYATWPWARDELGDARPEVLPSAELNFEQIAALEPDLIVGAYAGLTENEYGTLSEIAPTVAQSGEYPDYGTPWQEMTRTIGAALDRQRQADSLVSDIEDRFAAARDKHPEFEGATCVVADGGYQEGKYGILGPDDPRGRFITSLGFEYPERIGEVVPDDEFSASVSYENLALVDTDVLVWLIYAEDQRSVEKDPVFRELDVARRDAVLFLDNVGQPLNAAIGFSTVLSLPFALERIVPMLASNLEKNA